MPQRLHAPRAPPPEVNSGHGVEAYRTSLEFLHGAREAVAAVCDLAGASDASPSSVDVVLHGLPRLADLLRRIELGVASLRDHTLASAPGEVHGHRAYVRGSLSESSTCVGEDWECGSRAWFDAQSLSERALEGSGAAIPLSARIALVTNASPMTHVFVDRIGPPTISVEEA